jgi:hypothetical protein
MDATFSSQLVIKWPEILTGIGTMIVAVTAIITAKLASDTGIFDKKPNVSASGTFIISIKNGNANRKRDRAIKESCIHTLQLVNVGRGLAKNVTPSAGKDKRGKFLEDVCPHSFVLPPGKSTRDLGEILRVHGQRFVSKNEYELEFENNRHTRFFYIHFEDHSGKQYATKVKINKVQRADGEMEELRTTSGIEIWKTIDNTVEEI